mgnify:CR=1 FL=1
MGSKDDVGQIAKGRSPRVELVIEGVSVGAGFRGENVDGGTSEVLGLQGLDESGDVNDLAAGVVDKVGSLLHLRELLVGYHVDGFREFWDVQGNEVGLCKKPFEGLDLAGLADGHNVEDVVKKYPHAKGLSQDRQLRTNVAVSNNAQRLASDLPAALGLLVPDASLELISAVEELSGEADELGDDKLSDGTGVGEG